MNVHLKQGLAVTGGLVVAAVMLLLGLWQMSSYQESTRDVSAERAAEAPVSLAESVGPSGEIADIYGHRVTVSGSYLPAYQVTVGDDEEWRIVTALRMEDGRHVAVVRGAADPADSAFAPPPAGEQDIVGVFLAPDLPADNPSGGADMPSLRVQELAQEWPSPLVAGYVTLPATDSAAQGLREAALELPAAEGSATHRGYALQWWVFAAAAAAFGIYVARGFREDERVNA